MKSTAILATALGLAGFGAGRWLWPAALQSASVGKAVTEETGGGPASTPGAPGAAAGSGAGDLAEIGGAGAEKAKSKLAGVLPAGPRPSKEEVRQAPQGERLNLLLRWLAAATAPEVAEMAEALQAAYSLQEGMWTALAARWVEVDPEAALAFARPLSEETLKGFGGTPGRGTHVRIHLVDVYKSLLKLNPELALSKLPQEPSAVLRQLLQQLSGSVEQARREAWAAANAGLPEAALWAAKTEKEKAQETESAARAGQRRDLHSLTPEAQAIQDLIKARDLAGSRAKIDALPQNFQRAMLELDYASALATEKSPQEAADWAKANLKGLAKAQAITLAARELSKTDPAKALAMLREHQIPDLGNTQVGLIEVRTDGTSTSSYRRGADRTALQKIVSAAAKTDPKAAMDYLLSAGGILPRDMQMRYVDNDDTTNNGSLGRTIYKQWVASDPRAAASWLAAQPGSKGLSEMLPLVAGPLASQNGAEGRAFVLSLPQGAVRQELIGYAAAEWAVAGTGEAGGTDALQWAADAGGAPALSAAFEELTKKNAEAASQNFSLLPPETQAERLQSLTDALGRQKPQALPQFYAGLPEEIRSTANLRDALTSLARQNVEQASTWLNEIPSGKARDSGISGLVDYLINAPQPDPEAAAHWAAASADPEAQGRRLQRVAEAWKKQDPGGAAAAIQSSQLAEPVRQQLLGLLNAPKSGN